MKYRTRNAALGLSTAILTALMLLAPNEAAAQFLVRLNPFVPTGLAGRDLNGIALSGKLLDGHLLVAVSTEAIKHNGKSVTLDPSSGRIKGLSHRNLTRAELEGILDDGTRLPIRVDDIDYKSLGKGHGKGHAIGLYDVSYETASGWQPLCGLDEFGDAIPAVPLEGRWDYRESVPGGGDHIVDPDVFTFACQGYVLEKCVSAGYVPWGEGRICDSPGQCETFTLREHHQACTRMLRADFCGDGEVHTVDGILVNLYDGLGIRLDTEDWLFEAEWDGDGAICAVRERLGDDLPVCADALEDPTCGEESHLAEGALLFSEVQP